jgi:hypothetical protein
VNDLLGAKNRVALSSRKTHNPMEESNRQIEEFFDYALKNGK